MNRATQNPSEQADSLVRCGLSDVRTRSPLAAGERSRRHHRCPSAPKPEPTGRLRHRPGRRPAGNPRRLRLGRGSAGRGCDGLGPWPIARLSLSPRAVPAAGRPRRAAKVIPVDRGPPDATRVPGRLRSGRPAPPVSRSACRTNIARRAAALSAARRCCGNACRLRLIPNPCTAVSTCPRRWDLPRWWCLRVPVLRQCRGATCA